MTNSRVRLLFAASLVTLALFVVTGILAAGAASSVVGDGSPGSCTESAFDVALAAGGTIKFNCGGAATIILTAQKQIDGATTIDGAHEITFSGGGTTSLFLVEVGASLTIKDIVLSSGNASESGGALRNRGTTTVTGSTVRNSMASGAGGGGGLVNEAGASMLLNESIVIDNEAARGGGIANRGALTITNSSIVSNTASGADAMAGGILVEASGELAMQNTEISHNDGALQGGALHVAGKADLANISVRDNIASEGAGVYVADTGIVVLSQSVLSGNRATVAGGGICNESSATLISTALSRNKSYLGGGIYNSATLIGSNLVLTDNEAGNGGGLYSEGTSILVNATSINRNKARYGGGIYNDKVATLIDVTIATNQADIGGGGGILSSDSAVLNLHNSTLRHNTAVRGGGVLVAGKADLKNVTLSSNLADEGGGIYSTGQTAIQYATFSKNVADSSGGGIHHNADQTSETLVMANSVIATGDKGEACYTHPDSETVIQSTGANMASDATCIPYFTQGSDRNAVDVKLGPLSDNGGRTLTHDLQPGSPAIDHGLCLAEIGNDQRGVGRPQGTGCDAGAIEYTAQKPPPFLQLTPTGYPTGIPFPTIFITPEPDPTETAIPTPTRDTSEPPFSTATPPNGTQDPIETPASTQTPDGTTTPWPPDGVENVYLPELIR